MPRLKDMLEQQGLNLQNANVSQQDSGKNSNTFDQSSDQLSAEYASGEHTQLSQSVNNNNTHRSNNYLLEAFA